MPRRRFKFNQRQQAANNAALLFYNTTLRDAPDLRRACADRHVLDDAIDRWKIEERSSGRPVKGASRSSIIFGLMARWKLIDSKVTEENSIIWRDEVRGSNAKAATTQANEESKATIIAKTLKRIRDSRMELESNRNGITVGSIEFGKEDVCRIGYQVVTQVPICNDSDVDVHCIIKGGAARQRNIIVEGGSEFELPAGTSNSICISYLPRMMGVTKSIVLFDFTPIGISGEDEVNAFSIARYIIIRAGDPDDYDIIKPTAPYIKKLQPRDDADKFSNPVRVKSDGTIPPFVNRLGQYHVPGEVQRIAAHEKEASMTIDKMFRGQGSRFVKNEKVDYSSCLTVDNYAKCMQHLLWIEEAQMKVDIKTYDLNNVPLARVGRVHFKLLVLGLAENRPSVLKGDRILIRVRGGSKYEGRVHRIAQEYAIMDLPKSFANAYIDGLRVDVRFTFSRTTLRTSHQALEAMQSKAVNSHRHRIIFPQSPVQTLVPLNTRIIRPSQIKFFNRDLNEEQQNAVVGIIQAVARPNPYLIYGPPGTGKTVTLVESIIQTLKAVGSDRDAKILICAPSNTAVDVVVERLSQYATQSEILRLVAFSREKSSVPESIIPYTNYDEGQGCFAMPVPKTIKSYKVVAVTIAFGGKLPNQGVLDHFTHVFIDEAGHAVEADAVSCLTSVTRQSLSNPPAVILAGDPKQLGPIIRSNICKTFGLEKSLLERISEMEPYMRSDKADVLGNRHDKRMITKLVQNYRSHPKILDIPNRAFYDGDLLAKADMTRSHRFVDWEHLPKRGFPIIFHGIEGEDTRESNSPSWFNPDEAQIVKMYVDLLIKDTRRNRCKPEDIGIITPYHRQVQKIRMLLGAHGYSSCKVGSVDEFQGSERPVIIISTVRSTVDYISFDQKHKLGFLKNEKRFNVAITRAQALLIMVGNPFTLENDPNWKAMIDHTLHFGGYTGVDYTVKEKRIDDKSEIERLLVGLDTVQCEGSEEKEECMMVSHVTAQEGPAWRSEE